MKLAQLLILQSLIVAPAFANFVGNDTQHFNPLASGLDFVTVHSSQTLDQGFFNTGVFINEAGNVLPFTFDANGTKIGSKDRLTFGDLNFAYGLIGQLELDVNVSYLLSQQTNRDEPGAQFSSTGLDEVRTGLKYNFLERSPYGAAVVASLNMNQVTNNPFTGQNSGPTVNLEGVVDRKFGRTLVAANVGYRFRADGPAIPTALYQPLPNESIASVAASYYFPSADLKVIGEIMASKYAHSVSYGDNAGASSEFLLGIKYDASSNLSLNGGGGSRISSGLFTPRLAGLFGSYIVV